MSDGCDYLPGCYRSISLMPGEGLASYLLRVAAGNGYPGITSLLRAIGRQSNRPLAETLLHLRVDSSALRDLGRMTVGKRDHLSELLAEALPPLPDVLEAIFLDECRIDRDALALTSAAFCPRCLRSDGYFYSAWEFAPITACDRHRCELRDCCEKCGQPISWQRRSVFSCGSCGAELADQSTRAISDPAVLATVEDFRALAPFRVTSETQRPYTVQWDEMFRIFKTLLLPNADWALGRWPRGCASLAPLEQRHQAIEGLARCRAGSAYDLSHLRWKVNCSLAPLAAIPRASTKEEVARQFLQAAAGLSRESAEAFSGSASTPAEPAAYDSVNPWPPVLRSRDDVAGFLEVSTPTVDGLMRTGQLIPPTGDEDGFDADAVIDAGRFLRRLLNLSQLSDLAGIEMPPSALSPYGLLPRWNGIDPSDHRVTLERVLEIQRLLMARWHATAAPVTPVPLRQLAQDCDRPVEALMAQVQRIASGEIERVGWGPPFRWADIEIDAGSARVPAFSSPGWSRSRQVVGVGLP